MDAESNVKVMLSAEMESGDQNKNQKREVDEIKQTNSNKFSERC